MRTQLTLPLLLCMIAACKQTEEATEPDIRWYRGNLHTHTLWSDGDDFPDMVVEWYREAGYDFLALSDHNVLSTGERWLVVDERLRPAFTEYADRFGGSEIDTVWIAGATRVRLKTFEELRTSFEDPNAFILIQSEEISDRFESLPLHINATNVVDLIPPQGGSSVVDVLQRNIDAVLAQRDRTNRPIFPHINHPNFGWAISVDDLLAVERERFFEIYNGHPLVHNDGDEHHPSVEEMWDIILTARVATGGEPMYGLAVDDAHHYHGMDLSLANPGRGWIMVKADTLTPGSVIEAMEAGEFYASTGVTLRDVRRTADRLEVSIRPEQGIKYTTDFIGSKAGSNGSESSVGVVLASVEGTDAVYQLKGDEMYVRARVVSSKRKSNPNRPDETERAWTQPVIPSLAPRSP
ncbi:MAG TPA: hypothetical protein VMO47_18250 [Rhodothermales bacterium]|nr:hypothetical protein [Rhodothermales bacterium]